MAPLWAEAAAGNPAAPFPPVAPKGRTPALRQPSNLQLSGQWGGMGVGINAQLTHLQKLAWNWKRVLGTKKTSWVKHHQAVSSHCMSNWPHHTCAPTSRSSSSLGPLAHTQLLSLFYDVCEQTDVPIKHQPNLGPRRAYHAYLWQVQQNCQRYLRGSIIIGKAVKKSPLANNSQPCFTRRAFASSEWTALSLSRKALPRCLISYLKRHMHAHKNWPFFSVILNSLWPFPCYSSMRIGPSDGQIGRWASRQSRIFYAKICTSPVLHPQCYHWGSPQIRVNKGKFECAMPWSHTSCKAAIVFEMLLTEGEKEKDSLGWHSIAVLVLPIGGHCQWERWQQEQLWGSG